MNSRNVKTSNVAESGDYSGCSNIGSYFCPKITLAKVVC
jgi:hypothetical protein